MSVWVIGEGGDECVGDGRRGRMSVCVMGGDGDVATCAPCHPMPDLFGDSPQMRTQKQSIKSPREHTNTATVVTSRAVDLRGGEVIIAITITSCNHHHTLQSPSHSSITRHYHLG